MKNKCLLILSMCLLSYGLNSQITLDHSFNYSTTVTKINESTYKYFLMDVPNKQCRIYNMDFSLYKTIDLPVEEGAWLYDIRFVSERLFNDDSNIEVLYTTYKWITTNTNTGEGYYVYRSKVMSENGTVLLDVPGALYSYVNEVSPEKYSLFLFIYDLSVDPYTISTNIYKLPGQLNTIDGAKKSAVHTSVYPNPATGLINIEYILPPDIKLARIHILDASGRKHSEYLVDGSTDRLSIETNLFPPGIYFYYLESGELRSEAGKFVIE